VSKAVLQAGKAFDMMLARNGKEPVLFRLPDGELTSVVQHITRLLAAEAGSIKNALPYVDGVRKLSELGLELDMEQLARDMHEDKVVHLTAINPLAKGLRSLPYTAQEGMKEANVDVNE
jgi:hypothetical protein